MQKQFEKRYYNYITVIVRDVTPRTVGCETFIAYNEGAFGKN